METMESICDVNRELFGAIIGLARSTEGNANRPTQSTHDALLLGTLHLSFNEANDRDDIQRLIKTIHEEKENWFQNVSTVLVRAAKIMILP